jgi:hypothetical protein
VRSYNGEADVVAQGPNNSPRYYWGATNSWSEYTIAAGGVYSSPAIAVRPTGEVGIVAVAYQYLSYYWAFPSSVWQVAVWEVLGHHAKGFYPLGQQYTETARRLLAKATDDFH